MCLASPGTKPLEGAHAFQMGGLEYTFHEVRRYRVRRLRGKRYLKWRVAALVRSEEVAIEEFEVPEPEA